MMRRRMISAICACAAAVGILAASPASVNAAPAESSAVPTGLFQIDASAGFILSLEAAADTNGDWNANVSLGKDGSFSLNGGVVPRSQKFFALPYTTGTYLICSDSVTTGGVFLPNLSCLDVVGASKNAGARIKLTLFNQSSSQAWRINNTDPVRPATRSLRNVNSGLYLDAGADAKPGSSLRQQPFVNADRQRFFIDPA